MLRPEIGEQMQKQGDLPGLLQGPREEMKVARTKSVIWELVGST